MYTQTPHLASCSLSGAGRSADTTGASECKVSADDKVVTHRGAGVVGPGPAEPEPTQTPPGRRAARSPLPLLPELLQAQPLTAGNTRALESLKPKQTFILRSRRTVRSALRTAPPRSSPRRLRLKGRPLREKSRQDHRCGGRGGVPNSPSVSGSPPYPPRQADAS